MQCTAHIFPTRCMCMAFTPKANKDALAAALGLAGDDEAMARRMAVRVDAIAALWGAPREVVQATLRTQPAILAMRPESLAQNAAVIRGILAGSGIPSWQAAAGGPWTVHKLRAWQTERAAGDGGAAALVDAPPPRHQP
ncbi:MAG: hypothetical protein J3K34DRAFT_520022 [Monoraphidium minutum]|nr:MAG: hypothetical protein J3K34DRAFT_520022 [Monoraphidium minutum]